MIHLYELAGLFPNILNEGFSAYISSVSAPSSLQLVAWNTNSPYFSSTYFNGADGDYTVPITGIYSIEAIISYSTGTAISATTATPTFVVARTLPSVAILISGFLPLINSISPDIRTILGNGTVTLSGILELTAGDRIVLLYDSDNIAVSLTLSNVLWSVYRLQ